MNFSWMFVILTSSLAAATVQSCKDLTQSVALFEFADPRWTTVAFKLGEGRFGQVYLKQDKNGQFYAHKVYKGVNFSPNSQYQNDLRAIRYLKRQASRFSFDVPDIEAVNNGEMRLTYYPGRTVLDVLGDPNTSPKVRELIKKSYTELTLSLMEFLRSEEFDIEESEQTDLIRYSAYNDSFTMGSIYIIIKPDNFIINPFTLKLSLIDAS